MAQAAPAPLGEIKRKRPAGPEMSGPKGQKILRIESDDESADEEYDVEVDGVSSSDETDVPSKGKAVLPAIVPIKEQVVLQETGHPLLMMPMSQLPDKGK